MLTFEISFDFLGTGSIMHERLKGVIVHDISDWCIRYLRQRDCKATSTVQKEVSMPGKTYIKNRRAFGVYCRQGKGEIMSTIGSVHEIPLGNVKAFIIEGAKTILVDTGIKPVTPEILAFFEKSGIKLGDEKEIAFLKKGSFHYIINCIRDHGLTIDTIICTHYHTDHTGSLKQLKETLNVPVAMHPLDIPFVEGTKQPPPSSMLPPKLAEHFKITPCQVDSALEDNQMFTPDLHIIHLAGHTPGNLCLLFKEEVLLVGDSIMGKNRLNPVLGLNEINPPMPSASMDQDMAVKNLKKLLRYHFKVILPSHGEPISENAKDKLQHFIEGLQE
jgi:glyoxylase-like metal-dependent hydrolase (beta-lactamase superfamily II)